MKRRALRSTILFILITGPLLLAGPIEAASDDEQLALAVRRQFGLSTDLGQVRSLSGREPSPLAGVPLTGAEERDMESRRFVQENLAKVKAYGVSTGDAYGGLYIDQAAGGVVVVSFVGQPDAHRAAIDSVAPAGAELRLRSVAFSYAQLADLHGRIERELLAGDPAAAHIVSVDTSIAANTVRVAVDTQDVVVTDGLRKRYGSGALSVIFAREAVAPDVCNSRFDCGPPWRGGIALNNACTSNFVARSGGVYHLLTAGHCFPLGAAITHNGINIGNVTLEKYENNSAADIERISMNAAQKSNLIYVTLPVQRPITSREARDADNEGDAVCQSGLATGFFCGTITSVNFLQQYGGGVNLPRQRKATYARAPGDSGAPVFYGNKAKGVHSGPASDGSGNAVYSHVWELEVKMGVTVYTG